MSEAEIKLKEIATQLQSNENNEDSLRGIYHILGDIAEANPALAEQVIDTINIAVRSDKNGLEDFYLVYYILGEIALTNPTATEQAFDTFKTALQSDKNDNYSLHEAYDVLEEIVQQNPALTEQTFDTFKVALQSDKNNDYSFEEAYYSLERTFRMIPTSSANVIDALKTALQFDNNRYYLFRVYDMLESITEVKPELAEQVFDAAKIALQSEENTGSDLRGIYRVLKSITEANPALAEQVFDTFKIALSDKNSRGTSLRAAYLALRDIVKENPELAEQVFDTFKIALRLDKGYCLSNAYWALSNIAEAKPTLAEQVLDTLKTTLQSNKNDGDSLAKAYFILRNIVENNPALAEQVFDMFRNALQSGKNNGNSLSSAYDALRDIAVADPNLTEQVFDMFRNALQSDKNDSNSLTGVYGSLSNIIEANPALAEQAFDMFKIALQSNKNDGDSLVWNYHALFCIAFENPELAEQTIDTTKIALRLDKNNSTSLQKACSILGKIAETNPTLAEQIFDAVKIALQSDKNDSNSLKETYWALGNIAKANPALAEQVLNTFKTILQSNKNNEDSLKEAYCDLGKIAGINPNLTEQVFDVAVQGKDSEHKLYAYRTCMKRLNLEKTIAKHPEIKQDLLIAYNGRFTSDKEFEYALGNFDKETLADQTNPTIFQIQQKTMNILTKEAALYDKNQKNASSDANGEGNILTPHKSDKSEEIKNFTEANQGWLIPASFNCAAIFETKGNLEAYINAVKEYNKTVKEHKKENTDNSEENTDDNKNKLSIHDAVYWLPKPMNKEANKHFGKFITKNLFYQNREHKMVHRPLEELGIIARNWAEVEKILAEAEGERDISKLKYNDILSICESAKYEGYRNREFAAEAVKHGLSEDDYFSCEDIYLAGLKVPEPFDSKKEFKEGKYVGRFLPREDVRTIFFGYYTNCCQHYDQAGESCAISTVKHPFSQLFVIEDEQGKIIAGSWTWENTEGKYREVCFDNIEALRKLEQKPVINKIYEQVGDYLTKEQNCHRVTIGKGNQDADVSEYKRTEAIPLPKLYGKDGTGSYTDAKSQVLLSENPNATPLDKTQESQRYIRDMCYLDKKAINNVFEAECLNLSNSTVLVSFNKMSGSVNLNNMSGLVIEDREKGIVGYCLYNKENKSVCDITVLPEYRTDKNASFTKLLFEMKKVIAETGGEWDDDLLYKEIKTQQDAPVSQQIKDAGVLKNLAAKGITS